MSRSVRKELRLTVELVAAIDGARGDVSFNRFVERALEQALGGQGSDQPTSGVSDRNGPSGSGRPESPASARASSPAVREAREALDAPSPLFAEAERLGVRPAREFVKPFRPLPKKS